MQRDLSLNVREARAVAGLSQEGLALAAEVDRSYVSQIERGIGNPSIAVVCRLAFAMAIDVSELLRSR